MMYNINDRAYLQYLAYAAQDTYRLPSTFEAGGVEVRVTEDAYGNLIFSFMGTTFDGDDIIKDIRALPWYSRQLWGWYHSGFLKGVQGIMPLIRAELHKHDPQWGPPSAHYLLIGHSKGGSEATIAAAHMVRFGRPPHALVTFGAPTCGDKSLRDWLWDTPGHRVTNRGDPVPEVPWLLQKLGVFTHHRGATQVDTSINSTWGIENHRMRNYIDALGYSYET